MSKINTTLLSAALLAVSAGSAHAFDFWAATSSSELAYYSSSNVSTPVSTVAISGLVGADGVSSDAFGSIYNIAFSDNTLYGLDGYANVYTLNTGSGAATLVSSGFTPVGFDAGLAYDPFLSAGGFRFVSDSAENVALSLTGDVTTGNDTYYGVGDTNEGSSTVFTALAIDPDFGTGYTIDSSLGILAETFDANFEEFFTVGSLGLDVTSFSSLEFLDADTLAAALSVDGFTSSLYTIDPLTGTATLVGDFGTGINAIAVSSVPEPSSYAALFGALTLAVAACRRRRA